MEKSNWKKLSLYQRYKVCGFVPMAIFVALPLVAVFSALNGNPGMAAIYMGFSIVFSGIVESRKTRWFIVNEKRRVI